MRWLEHLCSIRGSSRYFPEPTLAAIQAEVAASERGHRGEICFAVEAALSWWQLIRGVSARTRAHEVFAHLRVWDTRENTGVLVYLLLAEHAIEILADRGIAEKVSEAEWQSICERLQQQCAAGEFEAGTIAAVRQIGVLLARHFPADADNNPDELSNRPVLL